MAHLRPITRPKCQHGICSAYATDRVIDRWNSERGAYCRKHAKQHCDEQTRNEAGNDGR